MVDETRRARAWVPTLARAGYVANGIVYVLVGLLAAVAAFGGGGGAPDKQDALQTLLQQPGGMVLLTLVAIGFAGYAAWAFVQAGMDPEGHGDGLENVAYRIGRAAAGVVYVGLVMLAVKLLIGGASGGGDAARDWTARLLALPAGQALVAAIGVGVIAGGVAQVYRAWTEQFTKRLRTEQMSAGERRVAVRAGQAGLAAHGVVLGIIGVFLLTAALQRDPSEAGGLGEALASLAAQPYGTVLLAIVAIGLAAYGVYEGVQARWRRIPVP